MKFASRIATALLFMAGTSAAAEMSQLTVAGDLMVHPDQLASFFTIAGDKVKSTSVWDWPEIHFAKPYKTAWTQVQARGPFLMSFDTSNLKNQEVSFELDWADPALSVGQFQIDDTITRNIGGANVIIHMAGQCSGMSMNIPNGQWKVKGRLAWNLTAAGMEIKWTDFQFTMNGSAVPQANLGQCEGPGGLQAALQLAFDSISHDQSWLQDVLRDGILDWVQSSIGGLQTELMKPRTLTLKQGLDATWEPETLSGLGGGLVRVAGHLTMKKETSAKMDMNLDRSYPDWQLAQVHESGFVLPKDTLPTMIQFLFRSGDLQYRVTSDKVSSFTSLMQSRFMQFFVWPDLMSFAKSTIFYFDVTTQSAPALSNGQMMSSGGIQYDIQAPLVVHQWAPAGGKYIPYVDFSSQMSGKVQATVKDRKLTLQMNPNGMNVGALFRSEFQSVRGVNNWLAASLLGSRVQSYLSSNPLTVDIPVWPIAENMALGIRDVQVWKQSFRVPLLFKNSK